MEEEIANALKVVTNKKINILVIMEVIYLKSFKFAIIIGHYLFNLDNYL